MAKTKVVPIVKKCLYCGKDFECGGRGRPSLKQQYDSRQCKALSRIVQPNIKQLTRDHANYIAGLFDGEGSIILYDRGYGGRPQLRCTISNTFEPVQKWLVKITGTGSIVRHVHPPEKGWKVALTWQIYGQNAVAFLNQVLPFLIIKRDKAIAGIETQNINFTNPERTRPIVRLGRPRTLIFQDRPCAGCGKMFPPSRPSSRYHNRDCWLSARKNGVQNKSQA